MAMSIQKNLLRRAKSVFKWDKHPLINWNPSSSFSSNRFPWASLMREESVIFSAESIGNLYFCKCFVRRIAVCWKRIWRVVAKEIIGAKQWN